jgi:hypothetical protein
MGLIGIPRPEGDSQDVEDDGGRVVNNQSDRHDWFLSRYNTFLIEAILT